MIYFEHRKNKIAELLTVDKENGVEIDLRSSVLTPGKLHLAHDPWVEGDDFDEWLIKFVELGIKGSIILNTKEDALEAAILEKLKKYAIENYIFLDTAIPTFVKWMKQGVANKFFLRISKYEDLTNAIQFQGKVEWLWCDCFDVAPVDDAILEKAAKNFKLCLVSPELQGGNSSDFMKFKNQLKYVSAICTKRSSDWKEMVGNARSN